MILKVFTKRTKGGELIETGLEWKDSWYESEAIRRKSSEKGFDFLVAGEKGEVNYVVHIDTSIHGYEIFNDQGVSIEKYVTPISPQEMVEALRQEQDEDQENAKIDFKFNDDGSVDAEIISDALLHRMIKEAKENKLDAPYELIVSHQRKIHPDFILHIYNSFIDIMMVKRKDLPVDQFLLKSFQS